MSWSYSLSTFKGAHDGRLAAILRAEDKVAAVLFRSPNSDAVGYTKDLSFAPVQWLLEMTNFSEQRLSHEVDFFPLFQFGAIPDWDCDLTEEQRKDDRQLLWKMANHLKEVSTHTPTEHLQQLWNEYGPHTSICLLAQPFNVMAQPSGFVPERMVNEFRVPEAVLDVYRDFLGHRFGAENVFVNPQVQTMESLLANWNDFAVQAKDRLVEGLCYRRPIYDVQEVRDDVISVPIYGFPVGIRREWPSGFTVGEYKTRMENLQKIEVQVEGVQDMMLELDQSVFMVDTNLYGRAECQDIYDCFYRMVQAKINQARWENRSWLKYKWGCFKKRFQRFWEGQLST